MVNIMSYDFLTFIALIVSVIAGFITIIKFHSDSNKEITNLRIEMNNRMSSLESKFDLLNERLNSTNQNLYYTIPRVERIENIVFSNKSVNGVHTPKEPELEYY